jgi:hypothetical protein
MSYYVEETLYGNNSAKYTVREGRQMFSLSSVPFYMEVGDKEDAIQLCSLLNKWGDTHIPTTTTKKIYPCGP